MAYKYIIGIDEVGRGALAGPLCVGACMVRWKNAKIFSKTLSGIKDSKQLAPLNRAEWFRIITEAGIAKRCEWSTVLVHEKIIDRNGLSFALKKAIRKVLQNFHVGPKVCTVLLDGGIKAPRTFLFQRTIIKGDEKVPLIAAASIVAKVKRDLYMIRLAKRHPEYGFDSHKGYGTRAHYAALREHGISKVHRRSFLKRFQAPSAKLQTNPKLQIQTSRQKLSV
ncbi:MAG: hypothetical protein A2W52_04425 [Candidatus Taylorbacteria bacterium RIFCSPHIGHO2_02_49_25]|uniref:Ribonuclease n=1 Tax=Candidatus Taylorbacteria bacterium RIFCSPHIGHO2_02_49_25 TaxID=1802305 RepID=A0A1G2MHQ2_9BACT|nr:MAG: Ribonuclease HII [Parcubacteria group bacterium GW2011_GWF2_50_9]OHA19613.1 MAG: hypothetical protein A2759_02925 [Candidatus Taylorbacteria bacterium RIFCSPHIGHO2_01_FULL_49_60]OHA23398.1 MAG: hypothetical protein A2W52_04425 [Candidatus Taylorbacteria bacterium RIFCSPHIGHO2_02_49_25]OHA36229.1 MAG: hypothetical protein A2W65_01670 [Candidatus Taylorbacteria bacterium RIFCSPLOWO2_02_50_13]OHA36475.1 MAG: hypothetical protein A3B27_00475 [Candidatus Taylorbacteria bacterium RIFCSPLOWO2_